MKKVKYIINNFSELLSISKDLKLNEEEHTLINLDQLINDKLVSIIYANNNGVFTARVEYRELDLEEISSYTCDLISKYMLNKNLFSDFRYKMIFNENEEIMSFLTQFVKDNDFLENINDLVEGKMEPAYMNIAILPVYKGQRKMYNISSDRYLFYRGDDFQKVTFEHFQNILFVRDFVGLKI